MSHRVRCRTTLPGQSTTSISTSIRHTLRRWGIPLLLFVSLLLSLSAATSYAMPIKLHPDLAGEHDVSSDFQVSPDGARVVYTADQDTEGVIELYSMPTDPPTKLSSSLGPSVVSFTSDIQAFAISPDSTQIVFIDQQVGPVRRELFRVPIGGGPIASLSATLATDKAVDLFRISP